MEAGAERPAPSGPPRQVRVAAVLIAGEAVVMLVLAGYFVAHISAAATGLRGVLGQVGFLVLAALAVAAVAVGLLRGRLWARTPGILIQALMLPAVFSLIGPSHQALHGLAAGAVPIAVLAMLLGAPARRWAEGLDQLRRHG